MKMPSTLAGWLSAIVYGSLAPWLFAFAAMRLHEGSNIPWWSAYLIAANAVAFLIYAYDKLISPLGWKWLRVPEIILAWEIPLLGGGYGAILGMALNHKTSTDKRYFQRNLFLANLIFMGFWVFMFWQGYLTLADANRIAENFTRTVLDTASALVEAVNAGLSS